MKKERESKVKREGKGGKGSGMQKEGKAPMIYTRT
jgi:hypothetical protein